MTDNERFYDTEIAPKLLELARACQERGMSFTANVEYDPGETGRTGILQPDASIKQRIAHWAAAANGNVDSFMFAVMRHAREHGHSSAILNMLGVKLKP